MWQLVEDQCAERADHESDSHQVSLRIDLLSHDTAYDRCELLLPKQSLSIEHPVLSNSDRKRHKDKVVPLLN